MELILKETIDTLGQEGDIVTVKPGYGRNYLLPQGKAVLATKDALAVLEQNKAVIESRLAKERESAEKLTATLSNMKIVITQLAGTDDRLFGSVTSGDICEAIKDLGTEIDRKNIILGEPIKSLGAHKVTVKVGFQITTELDVQVEALEKE
jgi:large subunit ribosomal protein L9